MTRILGVRRNRKAESPCRYPSEVAGSRHHTPIPPDGRHTYHRRPGEILFTLFTLGKRRLARSLK